MTGANIETAGFGRSGCSERVALFNALAEGKRDFAARPYWPGHRAGRCPAAPAANGWPSTRRRQCFSSPTADNRERPKVHRDEPVARHIHAFMLIPKI